MPMVPLYDGPQVATRALNYDQASPDAFGAEQGRELQRVGAGLGATGEALDRINERQVQTETFDAEAKAKQDYVTWSQEAVKSRQGRAAEGLSKDATDWWGKAHETYGKGLSPMAQRLLTRSFTQQSTAALQSMSSYENAQLETARQLSLKATTKASIDSAVTDSSDKNIAIQRQNIVGAWNTQRDKYDEQTFNTLVQGELSQMHQAVFNKIFVESPTQAKTYYEVNQKEIDGTAKNNILARLKVGVADEVGGGVARAEFQRAIAGKGYNDPIPVDQIDSALVAHFDGKPEELKAARAELDRQVALRNKAQVETNAGGIEAVYGMHNQGQGIATIKRTAQWAALPAKTQDAIAYEWDQRARAESTQNLQDRLRIEQELQLKYAPKMLEWSQPEALAKMTRPEILAKAPEIGIRNTEELLKMWQSYSTHQVTLGDATIDNDIFRNVLDGAGINSSPPKGDKAGAQLVLDLRARVKSTLDQMQPSMKRQLTETEKTKVMQDIVNEKVLRRGYWSGQFDTLIKPVPVTSFGPLNNEDNAENLAKNTAVVVTNPKTNAQSTLQIASIPPAEYEATKRYLLERGITPTRQAIAQRWFEGSN